MTKIKDQFLGPPQLWGHQQADQQRQTETDPHGHQLTADKGHSHEKTGDSEQRPQVIRHPARHVSCHDSIFGFPLHPSKGYIHHQLVVRSISFCIIQGPATTTAEWSQSGGARALNVCSLILLLPGTLLTIRPTNKLRSDDDRHQQNNQKEGFTHDIHHGFWDMVHFLPGYLQSTAINYAKTGSQRSNNQRPSIHQHKQHDFEAARPPWERASSSPSPSVLLAVTISMMRNGIKIKNPI